MKISKILSLPKSIYVCLKVLPFKKALRLPILVHYQTRLTNLTGKVIFSNRQGRLLFGFSDVSIYPESAMVSVLELKGTIRIGGTVVLGAGSKISIGEKGLLEFKGAFHNSCCLTVVCYNKITFGNQVLASWNTFVVDSDFHYIQDLSTGRVSSRDGKIEIGDQCWICMGVTILKNTTIPSGCILGANATAKGYFMEQNCLISGVPGKVMKKDVKLDLEK